MSDRKLKILFVHTGLFNRFKYIDREILQSSYEVREIYFKSHKDAFKLVKGMWWADMSFSWFADWHSLYAVVFAKLLGKKSIVVAGGYDTANIPEIKFGLMYGPRRKYVPKLTLKLCDRIIANSRFGVSQCVENVGVNPKKINLIYCGLDSEIFHKLPAIQKESLVLTVGGVTAKTIIYKGLETFVKTASYLPHIKFILIGKWIENQAIHYLQKIASSNVEFAGRVSDHEIVKYFSRAKVYVQVSLYETFSLATAEAMLCECVPVVTQISALPEVVGDCGLYVQPEDPAETANKIFMALSSDLGHKARERIKKQFPLQKRKEKLISIIEKVFHE